MSIVYTIRVQLPDNRIRQQLELRILRVRRVIRVSILVIGVIIRLLSRLSVLITVLP